MDSKCRTFDRGKEIAKTIVGNNKGYRRKEFKFVLQRYQVCLKYFA